MPYPKSRYHPEAMIKILLTVIGKTPSGGATLQELKEAYRDAKDREPSDKTIFRIIKRINVLFDPLAYGEDLDPGETPDDEQIEPEPLAIQRKKKNGRTVYFCTRDLTAGPSLDPGIALLMALSLYPQQRHLLSGQFEVVMKLVVEGVLQRVAEWERMRREIEKFVYVSGYSPVRPHQNVNLIEGLLRAMRLKKRVRFKYHRSYDGQVSVREAEPYGLLCRHNVWYLVGRCLETGERRIFRLDHADRMEIVENSSFTVPAGFSLKESYGSACVLIGYRYRRNPSSCC